MSKIPGMGALTVVGAIGALVYSEVKMKVRLAEVNDRDPRQRIIELVINDAYSSMDIMELNRKCGLALQNDIYSDLIQWWCDEFSIRFNPFIVHHSPIHMGHGTSGVDKNNETLRKRIKAEIEAFNIVEKAEKEAYKKKPWYLKVNPTLMGILLSWIAYLFVLLVGKIIGPIVVFFINL